MIYKMIYKLCGSPARKHTFTHDDIQDDIQALWESSKKTHINARTHRRQSWEGLRGSRSPDFGMGVVGFAGREVWGS